MHVPDSKVKIEAAFCVLFGMCLTSRLTHRGCFCLPFCICPKSNFNNYFCCFVCTCACDPTARLTHRGVLCLFFCVHRSHVGSSHFGSSFAAPRPLCAPVHAIGPVLPPVLRRELAFEFARCDFRWSIAKLRLHVSSVARPSLPQLSGK